jgi:hypothetical protein
VTAAVVVLLALAGMAQEPRPYKAAATAEEAAARIAELGGVVRRVSSKTEELEVDFRFSGATFADAHLQYLHLLKNVVEVDLKGTPVTDAGLAHLSRLDGLKRLHLEKTCVTDAGLRSLVAIRTLEVLNLFETKIGDPGLETIRDLPNLKDVCLWQTRVTEGAQS